MTKEVKCTMTSGVSQKNGREYVRVEIWVTPEYKKVVFLDNAEMALYKATYK